MLVLTVCHSSLRPLAPIRHASVDDQWTGFVLADGGVVRLPTSWSPALARASSIARCGWEVVAGGCAIRWPVADELIVLHAIGESPIVGAVDRQPISTPHLRRHGPADGPAASTRAGCGFPTLR